MAVAGPNGKLIGAHHAAAVQELNWPADETARLTRDIDAGFVAVALRQPVLLHGDQRVGWWRVDPRSGETIGVMDTGFHQGLTDYQITQQRIAIQAWLRQDAAAWARVQARARLPFPIGESVARDLAIRKVWTEACRQLIALGY